MPCGDHCILSRYMRMKTGAKRKWMDHVMAKSFLWAIYFPALRSSFMTKIVASETATDSAIVFMGAPF